MQAEDPDSQGNQIMHRERIMSKEAGEENRDRSRDVRLASEARWDSLAKPLGSLGWFEQAVTKIAALRGEVDFSLERKTLLVFCADHGVVRQGVTQCGSEVTAHVARALAEGRSTVSPMARAAGCRVIPVDMGMLNFPGHPGVKNRRVRNGTGDISLGPAMSRQECLLAMECGGAMVKKLSEEGCDLVAVGEMAIGNTTAATALACALLGLQPEEATGRGAGLSTEGLVRKRQVIARALQVNLTGGEDTVDLLARLGGLEIAAISGAVLEASARRMPVLLDGMISTTAALCALRLNPDCRDAMLASHVSAEPAAGRVLDALGLDAPLKAGMHLGEGSGAIMLMPMLDIALEVYHSGQSFERLGIEAYRRLE